MAFNAHCVITLQQAPIQMAMLTNALAHDPGALMWPYPAALTALSECRCKLKASRCKKLTVVGAMHLL